MSSKASKSATSTGSLKKPSKSKNQELIKVSNEVRKILDSEGILSKDAMFEWFHDFISLSNDNLQISKKKFIEFYMQFVPKRRNGKPRKFCEFVFKAFDSHRTGYIDFFEFTVAVAISSRQRVEDKLEWSFKIYDFGKDGFIYFKEFFRVVEVF
jgi:Ca2+-binding EF-hand superfamily protein